MFYQATVLRRSYTKTSLPSLLQARQAGLAEDVGEIGFKASDGSTVFWFYNTDQVDAAITNAVSGVYTIWKGSVPTSDDLPTTDVEIDDVWVVEDESVIYQWTGAAWNALSGGQFVWKGEWVSGLSYNEYDLVSYQNVIYICTQALLSTTAPPSDTANWSAFFNTQNVFELPYKTSERTDVGVSYSKIMDLDFTGKGSASIDFELEFPALSVSTFKGTLELFWHNEFAVTSNIINASIGASSVFDETRIFNYTYSGNTVSVWIKCDTTWGGGNYSIDYVNWSEPKQLLNCIASIYDKSTWTTTTPTGSIFDVDPEMWIDGYTQASGGKIVFRNAPYLTSGLVAAGSVNPNTTNSVNLGTSLLRWANVYAQWGNYSGLLTASAGVSTNTITTNDLIATDGSVNRVVIDSSEYASGRAILVVNGKIDHRINGESFARWQITDDTISFGSGSAAFNVSINRDILGRWNISGTTLFNNNVSVTGTFTGSSASYSNGVASNRSGPTLDAYTSKSTGDSSNRWSVSANGLMLWGSGTATPDVNLYRSAANVLKTDDAFEASGGVSSTTGLFSSDVTIEGLMVVSSTQDAYPASSGDPLIYRTSAASGGTAPFALAGELVIQARSSQNRSIYFVTGESGSTTNPEAVRLKLNNSVAEFSVPISASGGLALGATTPPTTSTSTGIKGTITYDSFYQYICVATDTWKRVSLTW